MAKKLTILQILPALESGGVERGTLEIAKYLVENGHQSMVISLGGGLVEQLISEGSKHIVMPVGSKSPLIFFAFLRLCYFLWVHQIDIVHARSRLPAWLSYLAIKCLPKSKKPRFVTTIHGLYSVKKYSEIMTRGDDVIVVSNTVKQYVLDNYNLQRPDLMQVIHRGVSATEFSFAYKASESWMESWYKTYPQCRKNQYVLLLPGRITRIKGHVDFIRLVAKLVELNINCLGLIVGGFDQKKKHYANELHRLVDQLSLTQKIIFTGKRSDLKQIMSISSLVFSLSSKPEAFGRTVLEALALGVPVCGYNHGGVSEIMQKMYPVGLVEKDNFLQLIKTTQQLLENPVPVEKKHYFTKEKMLSSTLDVYQQQVIKG